VNADHRAVVLLNLFFLGRKPRDETHVEVFFDRHLVFYALWSQAIERFFQVLAAMQAVTVHRVADQCPLSGPVPVSQHGGRDAQKLRRFVEQGQGQVYSDIPKQGRVRFHFFMKRSAQQGRVRSRRDGTGPFSFH
jgi:hypothetical protein